MRMTLTSRLMLFFLAALAIVLAGFGFGLYLLVRDYLYERLDTQLNTALHTLVAAAEIEPDGVEWDRTQHQLPLNPGGDYQLAWSVHDGSGRLVDRSSNAEAAGLVSASILVLDPARGPAWGADGTPWRLARQQLAAATPDLDDEPDENEFALLIVTTAIPESPVRALLYQLGWTLALLSVGLWLLAALVGRWFCRRALMPLTRMAQTVGGIHALNLGTRLPAPGTADELGTLTGAFNGLLARLEESFERQRRFTGDASHQLRTPLGILLGQVEVARRRERTPAEYQHTLSQVHQAGERLRQVVEALLFLARAEADAVQPDLQRLDLIHWLNEHLLIWQTHPRGSDLRIESVPEVPLWVRVQPALLGQAVDVLLENACKYSPAGAPLCLRLWREDGKAALAVADHGCGLSPADLQHIFEPFYRAEAARRSGTSGAGLGLTLAQRIIALFGGTLAATSIETQGSCFTIRLPLAVVRTEAATAAECSSPSR